MRTKPQDFFSCDTTDKIILFRHLIDMDERIDRELELIDNKEIFETHSDQTFADYFIDEAEKLFEKNGYFRYRGTRSQINDLRVKIKNYDFWRAFMQALQFTASVFSVGSIPDIAQKGVVHIRKVVGGGKRGGNESGMVRREKAKPAIEKWQTAAENIWKKHSTYSKKAVAEIIVKRPEFEGGNIDTIRKSIKKNLS